MKSKLLVATCALLMFSVNAFAGEIEVSSTNSNEAFYIQKLAEGEANSHIGFEIKSNGKTIPDDMIFSLNDVNKNNKSLQVVTSKNSAVVFQNVPAGQYVIEALECKENNENETEEKCAAWVFTAMSPDSITAEALKASTNARAQLGGGGFQTEITGIEGNVQFQGMNASGNTLGAPPSITGGFASTATGLGVGAGVLGAGIGIGASNNDGGDGSGFVPGGGNNGQGGDNGGMGGQGQIMGGDVVIEDPIDNNQGQFFGGGGGGGGGGPMSPS